jgi:hypothetical protein
MFVAYLVFILATIALLGGFMALTWYEQKRGVRLLAAKREALDAHVSRAEFIIAHVDLAAFMREESRRALGIAGHAIAHLSLQFVRAIERLLTRLVRRLRTEHAVEVRPAGETREFVKTLTDFKGRLKDTMPEMVPVQEQI